MYKGTHRLVKIYQGMSKRARVGIVASVLAVGLAAGAGTSFATTSAVSYADTSAEVGIVLQHTLTESAAGVLGGAPVTPAQPVLGGIPPLVGVVKTGDTLTFTASNSGPDTFVITSANIPSAITFTSAVNTAGNVDTLTATVTGAVAIPSVPATVTAKVTDAFGDVALDTVVFTPEVTLFAVTQVEDSVGVIPFPKATNNNTTGNVDFTIPTGDGGVLSNAPTGVSLEGNSLVAATAAPGEYDHVKLAVSDAAGATSVEDFSLTIAGARVGYQGPKLSQGHAVEINAVRENVYFVQSGAPSWDKFTIVGPGKINGHEGWVNGHLGLNVGVYGGLEAKHGYTVYYQPVTAQGGSTPVPGSKMGYVYFVS